tara:strand:+ start:397 stop:534 length:138 start_codon:yes stop_codon:yes gene_type:complete
MGVIDAWNGTITDFWSTVPFPVPFNYIWIIKDWLGNKKTGEFAGQ